ncbi:MAG: DNA gyrase subunit A, partial [Hydrogenobacter thermophilus]|nr:DNA gyrase subunit A [Hydrogenobacter thermophilus]
AVKKINAKDIPARGRGSKGMTATARTKGDAVDIVPIKESVELMIATQEGKVFYDRLEEREIPLKEVQRWSIDEDIITRVAVKKAQ